MGSAAPSAETADLNLRLLRHLLQYMREHFGDVAIARLAEESRLAPSDLENASRWASLAQFEAILACARGFMRDDAEFLAACAYRVADVGGPIRFLIGAFSPADAYMLGAKNMRIISTISAFEPERRGQGRLLIRYRSSRAESRLMCLSRQAQIVALPTLWKLPPANVVEEACIARGDACCEYAVRVLENRRWLPTALGSATGGGLAFGLHAAGVLQVGTAWAMPLLGTVVGLAFALHRHARANRAVADDINEAYLQTARDDANTRRELFDLAIRQQHWTHLMELQAAERAAVMGKLSEGLGALADPEEAGPIALIRENVSALKSQPEIRDASHAVVVDLEDSILRLDAGLRALHRAARSGTQVVALNPRWIDTEPMAGDLRGRIQAMVRGKEVRTSVFAVREAPARVRVDVALFNRITDALLAYAARSTERGSIVVEIGGVPEMLTLKVSDTGVGMTPEEITTILAREMPVPEDTTAEEGWATGMWIVARMLTSIGGRLDVRSVLGQGTTFWAHYPVDTNASRRPSPRPPREVDGDGSAEVADSAEPLRRVH